MQRLLALLLLIATPLLGGQVRHELGVEDGTLVYYSELPRGWCPILLNIEGSFVSETGPTSVLRLHHKLKPFILDAEIGLVTLERRGADSDIIDDTLYHEWNTPSQRLIDHTRLVNHLRANPPAQWDGRLFIMGGSEGGPIAIKLAHATHPQACVVLVGCGDQPFREFIFNYMGPDASREEYDRQCAAMIADPDPTKFWLGQSWRYWADALDQSEEQEFLALTCPLLVVAGSEDTECASTDRLIAKARKQGQAVTYLRIEGMGHSVLDPQWHVMDQVIDFLPSLRSPPSTLTSPPNSKKKSTTKPTLEPSSRKETLDRGIRVG